MHRHLVSSCVATGAAAFGGGRAQQGGKSLLLVLVMLLAFASPKAYSESSTRFHSFRTTVTLKLASVVGELRINAELSREVQLV